MIALFEDAEMVEIGGGNMRDALTQMSYYLGEAARLAGEAVITVGTADAERMRRWLVGQWPELYISVTDAVQRGPARLRGDAGKVRRAFAQLVQHGWLQFADGPVTIMGKRRREAWAVRGRGR